MRGMPREILLSDARPAFLGIVMGLAGVIAAAVRITRRDVDRAIRQIKCRLGDEPAELLEAPAMTDEEMDATDDDRQEDDVKQ